MPPPRPRGVGYNTGVAAARSNASAPMSERQQMALLMQMTAPPSGDISRSHIKKSDHKKYDDSEESSSKDEKPDGGDNKDKSSTEDFGMDSKAGKETGNLINDADSSTTVSSKRNFSDVDDEDYEECDETKKKRKKDLDSGKELKGNSNLRLPAKIDKQSKQSSAAKSSPTTSKAPAQAEKEPTDNAKANFNKAAAENDADDDDFKMSDAMYSGGPKVPPLKIVIPQQNCGMDTDGNVSRTGKINTSRNAGLPYVVSSNNNDPNERELLPQCGSPHESPVKVNNMCVIDEKNMKLLSEDRNLPRVLRSSHRSGATSHERTSNNSSPQMQSSSPSPASSNQNELIDGKMSFANMTTSPSQQNQAYDHESIVNLPSPSTSSTSSSKEVNSSIAELHPRKRKIRSKTEDGSVKVSSTIQTNADGANVAEQHPHDFPFTNCFNMYLNIRRQIEKKWKNLYPVKPRPPQGYNEYLLNKRNYLLAGKEDKSVVNIPKDVSPKMKSIFVIQERERRELYQRHIVEKEKLCLNVEQEILRVHAKAARNVACQSLPFSACTLLKEEEVYNLITPEQEEKDRSARHRFNGRLLLSWLQDVDDKWEKIKESMVLRHHNEAESLHAVQLMDWEIALKKYQLCDYKSQLQVEEEHVPIVHVSDDFDLLPA